MMKALHPIPVALAFVATAVWHSPAAACGGLFCSANAPVEQTAERIVFADNQDGTTTAIIEIQYAGPSERFAWVLPMPGTPKVDVSDVAVLNGLDQRTEPAFNLQVETEGECQWPPRLLSAESAQARGDDGLSMAEEDGGIEVLDTGVAGPYQYTTISASGDLTDPAAEAVMWLQDNGYDVGALGPDALAPYLEQGLNLIAFKLSKGQDAGAIRPIQLTYEGGASIPIKPTAVAAANDMAVRVFLLGGSRAVSDNFLDVTINEARINWFDWRSTYDEVVTQAIDDAGTQAFVTEFAGSTDILKEAFWSPGAEERWQTFRSAGYVGVELLQQASFFYRGAEGYRRAVELSVTLPEGVAMADFARNPTRYETQAKVDSERFMQELETGVVEPLMEAQELADAHPYLSRLYTTISPDEMTADPAFGFHEGLEDVSRIHDAKQLIHCEKGQLVFEAPWTITLANGVQIEGEGQGLEPRLRELPAAGVVREGAAGSLVMDNTEAVVQQLEELEMGGGAVSLPDVEEKEVDAGAPDTPDKELSGDKDEGKEKQAVESESAGPAEGDDAGTTQAEQEEEDGQEAAESGCAVAPAQSRSGASWSGLALLGLMVALRRRRR